MELFLECFCTLVLSLLLSFFISKLLSFDPTGDHAHAHAHAQPDLDSSPSDHVIDETAIGDCKIEEDSTSFDAKIEKKLRFSDKVAVLEAADDGVEFENEIVCEDIEARLVHICGDDDAEVGAENFREVGIEDILVDESTDSMRFKEIAIELAKDEVSVVENVVVDKERLLDDDDDDDDWEGIERTELEKQFGEAVAFVQCRSELELGSDVEMQLYGLHKVATEGPCRELQPMAFKVSARAKWHAWQKLGNLSPEASMEQYIKLLSQSIPGWLGDDSGGHSEQSFSDAEASAKLVSDLNNVICNQTVAENESANNEMHSNAGCP